MQFFQKPDGRKLLRSLWFPLLFVAIMWGVHLSGIAFDKSFVTYGVHPRDWVGLRGILFSPFIHGDWKHLVNNSTPIFLLGTALFYFYRGSAWTIWLYGMLISGLWVWVGGRPSFHIGASGLVYVFAFFLFFGGVFNRNTHMMGISLLITFLYGSLVWGIFPIEDGISWESHLFGAVLGLVMAFVYRKDGPQRKKFNLDEGIASLEEQFGEEYWKGDQTLTPKARPLRIRYIFKPTKVSQEVNKSNEDEPQKKPEG